LLVLEVESNQLNFLNSMKPITKILILSFVFAFVVIFLQFKDTKAKDLYENCMNDTECKDGSCSGNQCFCDENFDPKKCMYKGDIGATCLRDAGCKSGNCDETGHCALAGPAPPSLKGTPENPCDDGQCTAGGCAGNKCYCSSLGTCHLKLADGQMCTGPEQCISGKCGSYVCGREGPGPGEQCGSDAQCTTGDCAGNKCYCKPGDVPAESARCAVKGDQFAICTADNQCLSGDCDMVENECTAATPTGVGPGAGPGAGPEGEDLTAGKATPPAFQNPLRFQTGSALLSGVLSFLISGIGLFAVGAIIIGGFMYMTSAGSEERIKLARSILTYAIIGLIVALLAYIIVNTVIRIVGGGGEGGEGGDGGFFRGLY
jgi:hypothetical protein